MKKIILILSILFVFCNITNVFANDINQDETIIINGNAYGLIKETENKSENQDKTETQINYASKWKMYIIEENKKNTEKMFIIEENKKNTETKEKANEETVSIKTSIKEKFGQMKINKIDINNIFKSETKTTLFGIVCILAVVIFLSALADNSVGYAIFMTVIFLVVMIPTISMSLNEIISWMIICPFIPVSIVLITIMHLYNINVLRGGWSDFIKEDIPLILGVAAVVTLFMATFIL